MDCGVMTPLSLHRRKFHAVQPIHRVAKAESYQVTMITGCFAVGCLLSRPSGTLSSTPSGGEGWGEEAPLKDSTEFHCEMV